MTDHKTVREALRLAEKKCFDATGRIDLELSSSITQAIADLDRIEATTFVPKFTEEQWLKLFKTVFARTWTPEQAVEHMKDDVSVCVATAPKTTDAEEIIAKIEAEVLAECQFHGVFDAKRIAKDVAPKIAGIFSALRAPAAVPQEVVEDITARMDAAAKRLSLENKHSLSDWEEGYEQGVEQTCKHHLVLLQQKGGE